MRLWFAAVRPFALLLVVTVLGLGLGLLHGRKAAVPSISLGTLTEAPLVAVFALIPAIGIVMGVQRIPAQLLILSVRPIGLAAIVLVVAAFAVVFAGAMVTSSWHGALEITRNVVGLFGMAVLGRAVFAEAGQVLFPVAFLLLCFLFGRSLGELMPNTWAWALHDGTAVPAICQALVWGVLGLALVPRLPGLSLRHGS